MAFMVHIATGLVQQIVNRVHVMMSLVIVLRGVAVDSMVYSVKTLVLQTVILLSVTKIWAHVALDASLVSLAINAMSHVLLTVLEVVTKSVVSVQSVKKAFLVGNVANHALYIVRVDAIKSMAYVTVAAR